MRIHRIKLNILQERGRGQPPRQGQQVGRPPLTPTAPPMAAQQAPRPITTRGRGRGGANIVIKRGGRQGTPPPQNPQQITKKVTFQPTSTGNSETRTRTG